MQRAVGSQTGERVNAVRGIANEDDILGMPSWCPNLSERGYPGLLRCSAEDAPGQLSEIFA